MSQMDDSNKIGVVAATFLVAGNMMGSGVFMLPANLAAMGSISLFGWLVTLVGAVALALIFSKLTNIYPVAGGPYAFARKAFGNYMGFQTNLIYWIANVIGNVALAVVGLGYLVMFFPILKNPMTFALAQICVIWFFTFANMIGPKLIGRIQSMTTSLALFPIVLTAILGWFWFDPHNFEAAWNVTGKSDITAIGMCLNFTLWAFIGVESASVSAGVVKNPARNVPIATVSGVIVAAICYILGSSVIMGIIPNHELINSSAPFADAARVAFGDIGGYVVAICAALGCLGSLGGWTLLVGQTAKAASDDGLFPNVFARTNAKGVPSAGLAIVAIIMTVQVLASLSPSASQQFGEIASIAVILTLLPYIYSCIAIDVMSYGVLERKERNWYNVAGLVGAVYCMIALVTSNGDQTRWSLIFVICTIIFYMYAFGRQKDIVEGKEKAGGVSPLWVRYGAILITIATLVGTFVYATRVEKREELKHRTHITVQEEAPSSVGSTTTDASSVGN